MFCVYCDEQIHNPRAFCSVLCQQKAKHVRYGRARLADGTFWWADQLNAMLTKIHSIDSGGYDARNRHLQPTEQSQIIERQGGRCHRCGGSGNEIHHRLGSSNDPKNLELLCTHCHSRIHGRSIISAHNNISIPRPSISKPEQRRIFLRSVSLTYWGPEFLDLVKRKHPLRISHNHLLWRKADVKIRSTRGRLTRIRESE